MIHQAVAGDHPDRIAAVIDLTALEKVLSTSRAMVLPGSGTWYLPINPSSRQGNGMTEVERPRTDIALKHRSECSPGWPGDDPITPVSPVIAADRADCCIAGPVMRVFLPPTSVRTSSAQLLLCAHHCRESRTALARAGAAVYDAGGELLSSGEALARDGRKLWLPL